MTDQRDTRCKYDVLEAERQITKGQLLFSGHSAQTYSCETGRAFCLWIPGRLQQVTDPRIHTELARHLISELERAGAKTVTVCSEHQLRLVFDDALPLSKTQDKTRGLPDPFKAVIQAALLCHSTQMQRLVWWTLCSK